MLIRDASIGAGCASRSRGAEAVRADVRIARARIARIAARAAGGLEALPAETVIEARGGALLPSLHDHHLHLLALAADLRSLRCGPPQRRDRSALRAALCAAVGEAAAHAPVRGVRGTGYHESVAGPLDRWQLDAWIDDAVRAGRLPAASRRVPVRIQHRSGAAWVLNSAALEAVGIAAAGAPAPDGVERDARGVATGRLLRLDAWLRQRLGPEPAPDLHAASRLLARSGVASVTDATPRNDAGALACFARAQADGALLQRVRVMGTPGLAAADCFAAGAPRGADPDCAPLTLGEHKIVLDESAPPGPDALAQRVAGTHAQGRAVAIHCVTRSSLVQALVALEQAGVHPGDRIEHASVCPPELTAWIARLGLCVVSQPGFVFERGDEYLRDVEPRDRAWLYRGRGLERAGVALGGSTDAPYGDPDPWRAMRAAVDRRTRRGAPLGSDEALTPERALALFTSAADAPGAAARRVAPGAAADLVLLDRPWRAARDRLCAEDVAATVGGGRLLHAREAATDALPDREIGRGGDRVQRQRAANRDGRPA